MAGTDMNSVVSLMQDTIQTQQNSIVQGLASGTSSSGKTGTDFEAVMKASTSNAEELKSVRSVERPSTSEVGDVKDVEVTQAENSEQVMAEETVEQQLQKSENKIDLETKELFAEESMNIVLPQKLQDLLGKTGTNANTSEHSSEDLQKALAEIEEQLMQKIMESFDVTEDELKEAMEALSITMVDLLQTDNLKELAVYVSGEESLVSLVTNADMYNAYKEVVTGIEEMSVTLMEKFSITPEELQEIVNQLKEATQNTMENGDSISAKTPMEGMEQPKVQVEAGKTEKQPQIIVEVSKTVQTSEEQSADDNSLLQEKGEVQTKAVATQESATQDSASQKQNNFTSTENGEKADTAQKTNENPVVQTNTSYSTVVTENEVQTVVKTQRTDFDGIVRQIVEQIKVEIKPDVSSMELQLNPENLGKVNLQVTSKEGAVTAQLFVQNETVKAMVESQLMVLREAMNEQGVKVEAVEVTVETGEFGRSLEHHSEQQKQEAEKQAKSYQHKGINLLAGIEEEAMSAEEMLKAHIMRESGNSVDMNA